PPAERVLVLTTDLPFLTAEGVVALLDACPGEAGLILPIIQREEFEARFPGAWRRYVHLRDGDWIIGCACVMSPAAAAKAREHFERAFAHRKNVFALAWALGPSFLARLVLRRLTVDDIERRGGQMLACECRAVRGLPAELGFDIDRPVDYRYAMAHAEPASDAR
ncbi:MAG: acylneuraminate cytidylyltransferase, partial [Armatimonadota bacterium]